MLNEDVLLRALRAAEVPDAPVHYYEVVDSTNGVAMALARDGAPEWTIVAAGHQTAGRGRLGRTWASEPGSSLLFSFVLRPRLEPERASLLTLLAGAAMANACRDQSRDVRCKWPNDLLLEEAKVGGILAEASVAGRTLERVVIGLGMNLDDGPVGIEGAGGLAGVDDAALVESFLAKFAAGYRQPDFASSVLGSYRPLCATLGRWVRARTTGGQVVAGVAEDLDTGGNLLVRTQTGLERVGFGEVEHLR